MSGSRGYLHPGRLYRAIREGAARLTNLGYFQFLQFYSKCRFILWYDSGKKIQSAYYDKSPINACMNEIEEKVFSCMICGTRFDDYDQVQHHYERDHKR
jgi:hypothetical protein